MGEPCIPNFKEQACRMAGRCGQLGPLKGT